MKKHILGLFCLLLFALPVLAADTIVVQCTEDYYAPAGDVNDAQFSLSIDGTVITANTPCTAKGGYAAAPQVITFSGDWGGTTVAHKIVITFLNDAWGGTGATDRNLYSQSLTFDGVAATVAAVGGGGCNSTLIGKTLQMFCNGSTGSYTTAVVTPPTPPPIPPPTPPSITTTSATITIGIACGTGTAPPATHTVSLSWTASTSSGVTGYNVYRSTVNGSGYVKIGSTAALTYIDLTVANATTYYYVATAVSAGGESGYSNQSSAAIP